MSRRWTESEELQYEHQFSYVAYVQAPIDSSAVVSLSKGSTDQVIVVPHCEAWKKDGINDKAALVSRAAAHNYFVSPIDYFYLRWNPSSRTTGIVPSHRNDSSCGAMLQEGSVLSY